MRALLITLLSIAAIMPVRAQTAAARADPTAPLAETSSAQGGSAGSALPRAAAASALRPDLVLVSPTRSLVLLDGQWLRVGDSYGEARVLRIGPRGLTLRSADGKQVLLRLPAAEKHRSHSVSIHSPSGDSR